MKKILEAAFERVKSALHYHPLNHGSNVFGTVVTPGRPDVFGLISSRLSA